MRCDFAHDDGAYVLGALSPVERSAYERHLSSCPACREAVAEIAVLPGLLGRLDSATALQLLGGEPAEEGVDQAPAVRPPVREPDGDARVISLVSAAAERRRRDRLGRRLRYAGSALAAACLALVVALGVGVLRDSDGTAVNPPAGSGTGPGTVAAPQMSAMSPDPAVGERITAMLGLEARDWGTAIHMECSYKTPATGTEPTGSWVVHAVAIGPDGQRDPLGSWTASPGKTVNFTGATRFSKGQLARVELVGASGRTLLTYDVA